MSEQLPAIRFRNVSKRFMLIPDRPQTVLEMIISVFQRRRRRGRELWAVRDLTLDVMPGDSLGIIGRNGSGKSTLLKLIARILRPTGGRLMVRGRVSALLELGAGFHPDLTGRENIYLNGSVLGLGREEIDACFDSIVAFSELEEFIHMPVKHYSSGMYMRLGFSVAIHVSPDILLVDEILAVGDQGFQKKCVDRIYEMKQQGTTIVIVSHHTDTVRDLCSHALWVEHGEMQTLGPVEDVLAQYAAFYAARDKKAGTSVAEEIDFERWGTGEIQITDVRLLDVDGQERDRFKTGDVMTIAIDYEAPDPVHRPHFELALHREDDVLVSGPTTRPVAASTGDLQGTGTVFYRIDYLPLLPATYTITVSIHDGNPTHAYDHHQKAYRFRIGATANTPTAPGLVDIPATWEWVPQQKQEMANEGLREH